jgi:hypothetical protein
MRVADGAHPSPRQLHTVSRADSDEDVGAGDQRLRAQAHRPIVRARLDHERVATGEPGSRITILRPADGGTAPS